MIPAPRKPTPEGMAAVTLEASHLLGPFRKPKVPQMVKRAAPMLVRLIVRIPAGLSMQGG